MSTLGTWVAWARNRIASQVGLLPFAGDGASLVEIDPCAGHRVFDLRVSGLPVDDGLAAPTALRLSAQVSVRVLYDLGSRLDEIELIASDDLDAVAVALATQSGLAKVDGHAVAGQATPEILHDGAGLLVSLPVTVWYRR